MGQKWRDEKYFKKETDLIFKQYLNILQDVFQRYSGKKTPSGQKK